MGNAWNSEYGRMCMYYVIIGAHLVYEERQKTGSVDCTQDKYGGHVGLFEEIARLAEAVIEGAILREDFDTHNGVYVYDVCEPMGKTLMTAILDGKTPDAAKVYSEFYPDKEPQKTYCGIKDDDDDYQADNSDWE